MLLALLAPLACDADAPDTGNSPGDTTGETGDSGTDSGENADGMRTFANCGGTVAADVPAFFARYFRCANISMDGEDVVVSTVDLPPYASPYYDPDDPNWTEWDDRGGDYFQNPNVIAEQDILIRFAGSPVSKGLTVTADLVDLKMGTSDDEYLGGPGGVGLDGVIYFNAVAGPGDSILDEAYTFDLWEAHPEMTGTYHHHSASPGPLAALEAGGFVSTDAVGEAEWELYGMMCDGTVLLGCREMDGSAVDAATLDAQDGHVGDIVDPDGTVHFADRYHIHQCTDYAHYGLTPEIQYYQDCGTAPPP
jgi:hypothetical protein